MAWYQGKRLDVLIQIQMLKENPLKMSEFLKSKYFFNEKSPSYNLISENDDFFKVKCPSFAWNLEK
jgi:hypothetical protein